MVVGRTGAQLQAPNTSCTSRFFFLLLLNITTTTILLVQLFLLFLPKGQRVLLRTNIELGGVASLESPTNNPAHFAFQASSPRQVTYSSVTSPKHNKTSGNLHLMSSAKKHFPLDVPRKAISIHFSFAPGEARRSFGRREKKKRGQTPPRPASSGGSAIRSNQMHTHTRTHALVPAQCRMAG